MKIVKCMLVLLMAILVATAAIACSSEEAAPTPTPTEIPTPTPTPTALPVLPDLVISDVTFNPATGCAGTPVEVTATIQNLGTQSSPSCQWSWQLYPGGQASLVQLPSLPPGGSILMHTTITLTGGITGTFNTTATVDTLSEVNEIYEDNNEYDKMLTVNLCDFQSSYDAEKTNIQTALNAYSTSHNGSTPVTNSSIQLNYPAGTYFIINMCALVGTGDLLDAMPVSCIDSTFDNCETAGCTCNQNAHYVWLVNGFGNVLSSCIGGDCDTNFADGYQGIWP